MHNNNITVLLIDDDAGYAAVTKHLLQPFQNKSFTLLWEKEEEKAIEMVKTNPSIDLILMDYYLPHNNGIEISKKLQEQKVTIPIIFLTTNKDLRIAIEAMKYGVKDYLVKEEVRDTVLARAILTVLESIQLRNLISKAEKEKLISEKKTEAIQQLVVTMCHEFNNPLAAIKISSDILLRQDPSAENKILLEKINDNISLIENQIIKLRDLNIQRT